MGSESDNRRKDAERVAGRMGALVENVRRVILFGSVARDAANEESDTDLAVTFDVGERELNRIIHLAEVVRGAEIRQAIVTEGLTPGKGGGQIDWTIISEEPLGKPGRKFANQAFYDAVRTDGITLFDSQMKQ